jgi:agmatinase
MSSLALLGVPWDAMSSWRRGPAAAPAAIRDEWARAAEYSNRFAESGFDLGVPGLLHDAGDVPCDGDCSEVQARIVARVTELLDRGRRLLVLGGDHAVTLPVLRAARQCLGRLDVLHLDAHADLYPEFEGSRFSHACTFARALEEGLVGRLVQLGIRTLNPMQRAVADRHGVEIVTLRDWTGPPRLEFERPVYVSIDLDALDPAFAPGVSHPEPGGLTVRDVITVLQRLEGQVVGGDLVEYNPAADPDGRTLPVCVKLVKELGARIAQTPSF